MLKIISMEFCGFKSFFNKTTINLDEPINIIIGPNGCGKSNICDAFKWVLGEQKVKSLRTSKMEDVIFAGSTKYKPAGMAEVTIKLKNENTFKYDNLDNGEEIEIKRQIFRNGKSEYKINGKICRLRDIHQFFEGTGLGFSPYAIIEQGEVSSIVSMKPLEKRELIEEAARIISFKNRKKSALLKLELSEKNLDRIRDIIFEIERNLKNLKSQANKARRYVKYMSLKRDYLKLFLKNEISKIVNEINSVEDNLYMVGKELKQIEERKESFQEEKNKLEEKIEFLNAEIYNLKEEKSKFESDINNFLVEEKYKKEKIESNKKRIEKRKEDIFESESKLKWLKEELKLKTLKHDEKRKKVEEFKVLFKKCEENFKQLENESFKYKNEVERLKISYTDLENKKLNLKNEILVIEEKIKGVDRSIKRTSEELNEFTSLKDSLEKEERELNNKKGEIIEKLSHLKSEAESTNLLLDEVEERFFELKETLNNRKVELEGIKHKIKTFIQLEDNKEFYSKEIKEVLDELKQFKEIKGILSDYINPGEQYVELIEKFLYSLFDIIITEGNIEKTLTHLKKKSPSVTLIIPDEKKGKKDKKIADEKILGQVKDFVKFDKELNPYLNGYIGDFFETYIVKNLNDALRLSKLYPDIQVLSIDGIFFGKKGIITIIKKGKKGILSFRKEKRELLNKKEVLLEEIEKLENDIEEERFKREELASSKEELKEEISKLKLSLEKVEDRISQNREEKKKIDRRLDLFKNENESFFKEKISLQKLKESTFTELEKVESEIEKLKNLYEEKKKQLNLIERNLEREKENFYSMKNSYSSIEGELKLMEDVLNQYKSQIDTRENNILKNKHEIELLKKEIEFIESELSEKSAKYKSSNLEILRIENTLKEKLEIKGELEAKLLKSELKLENIEKDLESTKTKRNELDIKLIELKSELKNREVIGETELNMLIEDFYKEIKFENEIDTENITSEIAYEKYLYFKEKVTKMGSINQMAIEEYKKENERLEFNLKQKKDIEESIITTKEAISEMERKSLREFTRTFKEVNKNFKETFRELFGGGSCELKLIDEENPLESGVEIIASPPGKKLQNIMMLSGGEKALTALALLIALFKYRPAPFCILDEVDAPLDDTNISRFLDMVKSLTESTQFIIMTHNRKTMEIGDNIYGVTMEEPGVSKILSVKLKNRSELIS